MGEKGGLLRNRIARHVFHYCASIGISNRERVERLTEQVIQRLEQTHPAFPGMESAIPESRLSAQAIQETAKQVLAEGSHMEVAAKTTKPNTEIGFQAPEKIKKTRVSAKAAEFSANALTVLERRYLRKDAQGKVIETPQDMFRRVAQNIASAELNYDTQADVEAREEEFYQLMASLDFLPNSPTLMNAGRELQQLSACFVLPIEDSMESIFDAIKYTALIHKSGGGTGFSFSRLRPEGDTVGSTGGVASGPVSFMRAFDTATDVIKQGGTRRGANMAILNVNHPDIEKFITAKEKGDILTNFNLSVAVTEDFMKAVEAGADYDLVNPRTGEVSRRINAKKLFEDIVDMAWRTGDPGIVFIDRMDRDNPTPHLGHIESTNPCGEQPLLAFESCNLGSINLAHMVKDDAHDIDWQNNIDWPKLEKTIRTAVRFLDDVIDMNVFPLPDIEKATKLTRKIGLGVMGFAHMLIKLGIPYDSEDEKALEVVEEIMRVIHLRATETSVELAEERRLSDGGVFPAFAGSVYDRPGEPRVRNATRTTIAPTGTLSIIAGCSSGIEPLFALSYVRNILDNDRLIEVDPLFKDAALKRGFYSEELMKELAQRGSIKDMENIPPDIRRLFVIAHDISSEWHVQMQAAFQEQTCNAVSKTINFPQSATRADIADAYKLAYKLGCKGITIYRDRSKDKQVLSIGAEQRAEGQALVPRRRAKMTTGVTERVTTGCGNIYVTVNSDERGICEVFSSLGKAGGCASAQLEAICRLISLALRSGVDVASVVKHLKGIRCPSISWEEGHAILSCPDAIGGVLERQLKGTDSTTNPNGHSTAMPFGGQCPECGGMLVYQEGCNICMSCGYTKCSQGK